MTPTLGAQLGTIGSGVVVGLLFRFAQGAVLARLLGVTEFGKYATFVALMAIVSRLNDLGLPSAVSYHFRRTPGAFESLRRVVYWDFGWCVIAGGALAATAPMLPLVVAPDLQSSPPLQLALAAYVAVNTPTWILPAFISAAGDYTAHARLANLDAALQATLAVSACLLFGATSLHVLVALTIEQGVMTAVYLWFLRRYRTRGPATPIPIWATISYGLRLQCGVLMKLVGARADILTVGALTTPALAGLYSVALNVRDIGLLPQSIYAAPLQNLVIDRAGGGGSSDRSPLLTGLVLQTWLSLAMALAAAVALPFLIPAVYGQAFLPGVTPAVVVFSSVIFLGPAGLCWMALNGKGRPDLTSWLLTISGTAGPVVTYLLLSAGQGLTMVAAGSVCISAATLAMSLVLLQHLQHYGWADVRNALTRARGKAVQILAEARWPRGRPTRVAP